MEDQEEFEPNIEEEEKPKTIKLTMKQRIWLFEYMKDGNQTRAALIAYYPEFPAGKEYKDMSEEEIKTYNAAAQIGYENLRKLKIPFDQLLDEAGLTDVYLTYKLKENLNATKLYGPLAVEHMDGVARNKALETALKGKNKLIDRVDHTTRGKSLLPKIKSDLSPEPAPTEQTSS